MPRGKLHSCRSCCSSWCSSMQHELLAKPLYTAVVTRSGSQGHEQQRRIRGTGSDVSRLACALQGFEAVKAIHLEPQQFTVEDELMTPTFKLKRPQLQKKYQAVLDGMYKALHG